MDPQACFEMTFPGLAEGGTIKSEEGFSIKEKPYVLQFKNIFGTWSTCEYCG